MFVNVAHLTACLGFNPAATASTYCLLAMSVVPVGVVVICPVVVRMFVKTPVDGTKAPIVVLLIVLFVMFSPDWDGLTVKMMKQFAMARQQRPS